MTGLSNLVTLANEQWTPLPVPPASKFSGGTYIVTGANVGLGFQCARYLVKYGAKKVIISSRSMKKGNDAKERIEAETGRQGVLEVWQLDLASLDSVEEFAAKVEKLDRLDSMIANASVAEQEFKRVGDFESSLVTNVIGTTLLAVRTIPKLSASATKFNIEPHLAVISSSVALWLKDVLEPDAANDGNIFDILSDESVKNFEARYPVTKLMQIYIVRELAGLFPVSKTNVTITVSNPGLCKTELARDWSWAMRLQMAILRAIFARTAEMGSRTLLHGAIAGPDAHGKFMSECRVHDERITPDMKSDAGARLQRRIWLDLVDVLRRTGHSIEKELQGQRD